MQSSEIIYLPVEQLHLWANSLFAKFKLGGETSYIDEAIDLDREGTCFFLSACSAVK